MSTEYTLRVTIIPHEQDADDTNQLALCSGESPADDRTFGLPLWQRNGELYALASTVTKEVFMQIATSPLVAPSYAPHADIEAASRAQARLKVVNRTGDEPDEWLPASPDYILAIVDYRLASTLEHLSKAGVEPIPDDALDHE